MDKKSWMVSGQIFEAFFAETAAELWGKTLQEEKFDYNVTVFQLGKPSHTYHLRVYKFSDRVWVERKSVENC